MINEDLEQPLNHHPNPHQQQDPRPPDPVHEIQLLLDDNTEQLINRMLGIIIDYDLIQRGDFRLTLERIQKQLRCFWLCVAFQSAVCAWIVFFMPPASAAIFFVEKMWLFALMILQAFSFLIAIAGASMIRKNPAVLLRPAPLKPLLCVFKYVSDSHLVLFSWVAFVDLAAFKFERYFDPNATPSNHENILNDVVRTSQALLAVFCGILVLAICNVCWTRRKKKVAVSSLKSVLKKVKPTLWKQLLLQPSPPTSCECSICLVEYCDTDNVLALSCHQNHVFHRVCFEKFLEQVCENIGEAKCPLCQQCIEFKRL